jgi:hypothetical protein
VPRGICHSRHLSVVLSTDQVLQVHARHWFAAVGVAGVACTYMIERPELRWAFIRKVYAIVATQLVVTVAIAAAVYSVPAIRRFFLARTPASLAAFVLVIVAPLIGDD